MAEASLLAELEEEESAKAKQKSKRKKKKKKKKKQDNCEAINFANASASEALAELH